MASNFIYLTLLLFHLVALPMEPAVHNTDDSELKKISALINQAKECLPYDPEKTKILASEALMLGKKAHLKQETAISYNILGLAYDSQGNYQKALDCYIQSLKLMEEIDDKQSAGVALNNIGQLHHAQNNIDLALEYLQKSLQYAEDVEDDLTKGHAYNNLGLIHYERGDFEKAYEFYKKANDIYVQMEDDDGEATTLHNIGSLYYGQDQLDSALKYVEKALILDAKNKYQEGIAANYNLIGEIYKKQGNYEKAISSFEHSLKASKEIEALPVMVTTYREMAMAYYKNSDFNSALLNLEKSIVLSDSLFGISDFEEISKIQTLYDSQLREKEIDLLQSQKRLDDISMSFHKTFSYLLLISAAILLFILFLLLQQNKRNNKANLLLEKHTQKIQEQNKTLAHYNKELNNSQIKLKEFNDTKDKFFSIISHDLKSPLNSLKGLLQLLEMQSDNLSPQELTHMAKSLEQSIENLSALLDNLLKWSMSQMGKIEQEPSKVDLSILVKENVSLLEMSAQAKNIEIKVDIIESTFVFADENMTSFVVRNLLSNAIKFTPENGCIKIEKMRTPASTFLMVEDNGVGISSESMDKLFKIGQNFTTRGTAQEKGTGLGLILCKEFVEKNNGEITVESILGKGTKFTIALPTCQQEPILA